MTTIPTPDQQSNHKQNAAPWRSMTAADALAWLVAEDVARRASERHAPGLSGPANRKRLIAWRREHGFCPKCGRPIPADEQFIHCPRCRQAFREWEKRRPHTEAQRLARNARARRYYNRIIKPGLPKVVTPMVTPGPMVTRNQPGTGKAKRDRAEYMRAYRANRKLRSD